MTTAEEIAQTLNSNNYEAVSIECGVAMSVQVGRAYFEPASEIPSIKHENNKIIFMEAIYRDGSMIRYSIEKGYEVAQTVCN